MKKVLLMLLFPIMSIADVINLNPTNTIVFRGEVSNESVDYYQKKMHELLKVRGSKNYKIYLVMDSPGGSVFAGENFIQYLKTVPNVDTITLFAASMGSAIVQGNSGTRYIAQNGIMMFHRASGGLSGQFETGEVESRLSFFKSSVLAMEIRNALRMNTTIDNYKKAVVNELWLYGNQAVYKKAADKQIDIVCSSELIDKQDTQNIMLMGIIPISIKFSACPLFRTPEIAEGRKDEKTLQMFQQYKENMRAPIAK